MGIKEFLERLRAKKAKYKEFDEDMRVQELYAQRQMSSNERELNKYITKEREKEIKHQLEQFRKREKWDSEKNHQILNTKNMFRNEKPVIMNNSKKLFSSKSNLNTPGGLFFK